MKKYFFILLAILLLISIPSALPIYHSGSDWYASYSEFCGRTEIDHLDNSAWKHEPGRPVTDQVEVPSQNLCRDTDLNVRGECYNDERADAGHYPWSTYDSCSANCAQVIECLVKGCHSCEDYNEVATLNCPSGQVCVCGQCSAPLGYNVRCCEGRDCGCASGCCDCPAGTSPPCIRYCRKSVGETCTSDGQCCTKRGDHCDTTVGSGHCCPNGQIWDGSRCRETATCDSCSYDDCSGINILSPRCGESGRKGGIQLAANSCNVNNDLRFLCCGTEWYACAPQSDCNTWNWEDHCSGSGDTHCGYCCDLNYGGEYRWSYCGDGRVNTVCGEQCDDGNSNNNDDCVNCQGCDACGDGTWDCLGRVSTNQRCGNNGQVGGIVLANQNCNVNDDRRFLCSGGDWHACATVSDCNSWNWEDQCHQSGAAVGSRCCDLSAPANMRWSYCGDGVVNTVCGEQCDDGNSNNADDCHNDCTWNDICTTGLCCDTSSHPYKYYTSTTQCRASVAICDAAEYCTGSSATCPVDSYQPSTTQCRASAGVCDPAEYCTGTSPWCPGNSFRPNTYVCRPSVGECDAPDYCTGSSATCPTDTKLSGKATVSGTNCPTCKWCDGTNNVCQNIPINTDPYNDCIVGLWACNGLCQRTQSGDLCNGNGACLGNNQNIASGFVCQATPGGGVPVVPTASLNCGYAEECDAGECSALQYYRSCTGGGACRSDNMDAATNTVRASAGYSLTNTCGTTGTTTCNNGLWACSSGSGNNNYGSGGTNSCQAFCDGTATDPTPCDYAGNCQNCGFDTCTDTGDTWTIQEFVYDNESCNPATGQCAQDNTHPDFCDASGNNMVYDRQCSGNDIGADTSFDCDNYDTAPTCVVAGNVLSEQFTDWDCNNGRCRSLGTSTINSWTCDGTYECQSRTCQGTTYICYRTNAGAWTWGANNIAEASETACADGYDNDCDGEKDWDTLGIRGPEHGDNNCAVGVTAINVNDSNPYENHPITITCTININTQINSVFSYIDEDSNGRYTAGDRDCGAPSMWVVSPIGGNARAIFTNCNVGSGGNKRAGCSIYNQTPPEPYDRSYQNTLDVTTPLTTGGCGDGIIDPSTEQCDTNTPCNFTTAECCNMSTCQWDTCVAEDLQPSGCTDNVDNDCDGFIDGLDWNCPEGIGMVTSPNRGCDETDPTQQGDQDDPAFCNTYNFECTQGDAYADSDDYKCCDFCVGIHSSGRTMVFANNTFSQNLFGTPCGVNISDWEPYNGLTRGECCGDDQGEYYNNSLNNDDPGDNNPIRHGCCNESRKCVDRDGKCRPGVENTELLCTNNLDDDCDGLVDRLDPDCSGRLMGYVFDDIRIGIQGALVKGSPAAMSAGYERQNTTRADGSYVINNAVIGTYYFIASKEGYNDNVTLVRIRSQQTQQVNFTLINGSCNEDCTNYYGTCNPACNGTIFGPGKNCTFISKLCYNRPKGYSAVFINQTNGTVYEYTCCEGPRRVYPLISADVSGDVEDLYDYVVNVQYGGKNVKLHIAVWK